MYNIFRCASACHPWPKTRRTLMIGPFLYTLFIGMLLGGIILFSTVFWPDKEMDHSRRQLLKSLGMLGVALTLSGSMLLYNQYAEHHSASDGVIYIPGFIVDSIMWIAIVIGVLGAFRLVMRRLSKRASRSKVQVPTQSAPAPQRVDA